MELLDKIQRDLCIIRNGKYIILSQKIKNIDNNLYKSILDETNFLNNEFPKLSDRIKYILKNKYEVNTCNMCGKNILNIERKYCSPKCNKNSEETKNKFRKSYSNLQEKEKENRKKKRTETVNERYGGYTFQSPELSSKVRQTMVERYGVEHSFQNEKSKEKAINTWIKKYGVDNPYKSEEIKEKIRMTLFKKYGVDNACYINSEERVNNGIKTKIERGWIIPDEFLNEYQKYRKEVRNLTEKTYKKYKDIINPDNLKRVTNGNTGFQLDHKYSILEGFLNDVESDIISNWHNLQMLECGKNRNKSKKCSIELDELIKMINYENE